MRRALAVVVAVAALTAAGCGVATRPSVDRADPEDVPFDLLSERPSSGGAQNRSGTPVDVYFYDPRSQRLVQVTVDTDATSLETVLRQLQEVPSGAGLPSGNPLADADVIRSVTVARGLATVDLDGAFGELTGTAQRVALAELVYTATGRPGVGQVTFSLDGQPIEVPRGDGSLTSEPLTRGDYSELAPLS